MFKRIIYGFIIAVVLLSSVPFVSVGAAEGVDECATVEQMLASSKDFNYEYKLGGFNIKYRRYNSPNYGKDDSVKATVILYFHDSEAKGDDNKAQLSERNLISQLVNDKNANLNSDYPYVVIAPQCPADKSFTSTVGPAYKYASSATDMMKGVKALVDEICSDGPLFPDRLVLIGEGNGGTAAFDYFSRYPQNVTRVFSVNGCYDAEKIATPEMANNKLYRIVVSKDNKALFDDAMEVVTKLNEIGLSSKCEFIHVDGEDPVEYILNYTEPSVMIWAVRENYSQAIQVLAAAGTGGTISPQKEMVNFNGSKQFVITQNEGYRIKSFTVNGASVDLKNLKRNTNNENQFTYSINQIKKETTVRVEFVPVVDSAGKYDTTISSAVKWMYVLGGGCLLLGVLVFALDMFLKYNKKAARPKGK